MVTEHYLLLVLKILLRHFYDGEEICEIGRCRNEIIAPNNCMIVGNGVATGRVKAVLKSH